MAYADDAVRAKLSALNETQDSIVSVAQWVMFHRYCHRSHLVLFRVNLRMRRQACIQKCILIYLVFCRRHADRTAELWLERLKESNTSKKLNLIYLANGNPLSHAWAEVFNRHG